MVGSRRGGLPGSAGKRGERGAGLPMWQPWWRGSTVGQCSVGCRSISIVDAASGRAAGHALFHQMQSARLHGAGIAGSSRATYLLAMTKIPDETVQAADQPPRMPAAPPAQTKEIGGTTGPEPTRYG